MITKLTVNSRGVDFVAGNKAIVDKINELIDYLSDRDGGEEENGYPLPKEFRGRLFSDKELKDAGYTNIVIKEGRFDPPQQEESLKEDETGKDAGDIWRVVKDELEKDGFKLPIKWKSVGTAYGCFVKIQEILDKKYVSKEKIRRAIDSLVLDYEGEECEDKRIADISDGTLFQLEEKLGLEEL